MIVSIGILTILGVMNCLIGVVLLYHGNYYTALPIIIIGAMLLIGEDDTPDPPRQPR